MRFAFTVTVEVERITGKFASRDEIREALETEISDAIGAADLSGLGADGESEYEVTDSSVDESEA